MKYLLVFTISFNVFANGEGYWYPERALGSPEYPAYTYQDYCEERWAPDTCYDLGSKDPEISEKTGETIVESALLRTIRDTAKAAAEQKRLEILAEVTQQALDKEAAIDALKLLTCNSVTNLTLKEMCKIIKATYY